MTYAKLRNVDRFTDRHGKPRHYFRVGKGPRVRLPGEPGSPEFMAAYERAVAMSLKMHSMREDVETDRSSQILEKQSA